MAVPGKRADRIVPHLVSASGGFHSSGFTGTPPDYLFSSLPREAVKIQITGLAEA